MKREFVVVGVFIMFGLSFVFAGSCEDSQTIMRLYSATNSHVSTWNEAVGDYVVEVCYDEVFGSEYTGANPHECTGSNRVLSLSSLSNAHASVKDDVYTVDVCYGDLQCYYDESSGSECSGGGEVVASLSTGFNAHISSSYDSNYEVKVCCGDGILKDAYWADMDGNRISSADFGDMVKLVAVGQSSGVFNIKEDDPISDDEIKSITGESIDGNLIANWLISEEDMDKTESGDYDEFYFEVNGEESDYLSINENGNDDPMIVTIVSPICGEYYDEGDTMVVTVTAVDGDDLINGTVRVNGDTFPFTNGGVTISEVLDNPGDLQIVAEAVNSRGKKSRGVANIMVLDKEGGNYVDGEYIAACIDKPKDFSNIPGSTVEFDASTTRGVRIVGGVLDELIPGEDPFSWYWKFFPEEIERNYFDTTEEIAYFFIQEFPVAGENSASLTVEI